MAAMVVATSQSTICQCMPSVSVTPHCFCWQGLVVVKGDGHSEVRHGEDRHGNPVKSDSRSLTQNSSSFLLLEDFTRPGSQLSWVK